MGAQEVVQDGGAGTGFLERLVVSALGFISNVAAKIKRERALGQQIPQLGGLAGRLSRHHVEPAETRRGSLQSIRRRRRVANRQRRLQQRQRQHQIVGIAVVGGQQRGESELVQLRVVSVQLSQVQRQQEMGTGVVGMGGGEARHHLMPALVGVGLEAQAPDDGEERLGVVRVERQCAVGLAQRVVRATQSEIGDRQVDRRQNVVGKDLGQLLQNCGGPIEAALLQVHQSGRTQLDGASQLCLGRLAFRFSVRGSGHPDEAGQQRHYQAFHSPSMSNESSPYATRTRRFVGTLDTVCVTPPGQTISKSTCCASPTPKCSARWLAER